MREVVEMLLEGAGPVAEDSEALRNRGGYFGNRHSQLAENARQSQLRMTLPELPDIIASKPFSNSV